MRPKNLKVFLAPGVTDLRKAINGLSILVDEELEEDPFSGCLFGFCNRKRDTIKILYWDRNGFCLWIKKLEKDKFQWPDSTATSISVDERQLTWLLDGLNLKQRQAHKELNYSILL